MVIGKLTKRFVTGPLSPIPASLTDWPLVIVNTFMSGKNSHRAESAMSDNDDPVSMQNSSSLPCIVIIRAVVFVKLWYPIPDIERTYMPFSFGLQSFASTVKEMPGGKECGLFW